jgi:L-ascorbate metabolism protein UlaG (beta-lactamase superfamily)
MVHACSRKKGSAPIRELLDVGLAEDELAFIYMGYSGILLRCRDRMLAFDVGKESIRPDEIEALERLDIQFYSHIHWDHWDAQVTRKLLERTGAQIVAEPQVVREMRGQIPPDALKAATPGEHLTIDDVEIASIAGIHPSPIVVFHVRCDGLEVFHGADSGYVPLGDYAADVAFIPAGNPSPSCSPENALKMALDVRPQVAVAMHGDQGQLQAFRRLVEQELPGTRVITPEPCELVRASLSPG